VPTGSRFHSIGDMLGLLGIHTIRSGRVSNDIRVNKIKRVIGAASEGFLWKITVTSKISWNLRGEIVKI
jgi:hypothetical protein